MSERTLLKKVNNSKVLEAQKKTTEKQAELLQENIKKELQTRGWEETRAGDRMVRFRAVISNESNVRALAVDHPKFYQKYMGQFQIMRFAMK